MPSESTDPVSAAFFGLAFTAALHPKLLGADLLIIENRLPKALFMLPDRRPGMKQHDRDRRRAVRQAETQESVSRSVDPASGLCLLVFGALAGTRRLARSTGSSSWSRATTGPGCR
jgi:hypothetical protein